MADICAKNGLEEQHLKLEQLKSDFETEFLSFLKYSEDEDDREIAEEKFATAKETLEDAVEIVNTLSEHDDLFPNGLSSLPEDLRWESELEHILSQFDDILADVQGVIEEPWSGEVVEFEYDDQSQNLTKNKFIEIAQELAPVFADLQKNIIDFALNDTKHNSVENLFYMQPLETWDKSARRDLVSSLLECEQGLVEAVEFTEDYNNSFLARFQKEYPYSYSEQLVKNLYRDLQIEIKNGNLKGASHQIETIVDLYSSCKTAFEQFCPDIDLSMPNRFDEQIINSSEGYNLCFGVTDEIAKGYVLNNEPDKDVVCQLLNLTSDISIIESDDRHYIAFSSSERNFNDIAVAYAICDGDIPENIIEKVKISECELKQAKVLKEYLSTLSIENIQIAKELETPEGLKQAKDNLAEKVSQVNSTQNLN